MEYVYMVCEVLCIAVVVISTYKRTYYDDIVHSRFDNFSLVLCSIVLIFVIPLIEGYVRVIDRINIPTVIEIPSLIFVLLMLCLKIRRVWWLKLSWEQRTSINGTVFTIVGNIVGFYLLYKLGGN